MFLQKSKKPSQNSACKRLLINVTVLGSAGPLRFFVMEEELVAAVIDTALRFYAREGRVPVLGSDFNNFLLYCANAGSEALNPWEAIGSLRGRNFVLCKKQREAEEIAGEATEAIINRKGSGSWKAWFNKSLNFKISSH
ncbi:hypothetical protein Sjap_024761 [Stephania japonica]|uniref:DUF7054 domain-containing protein n=1 Tax=Stephania japonica TaxID=461633 RepID=A0AAP0EMM3_9MAGN